MTGTGQDARAATVCLPPGTKAWWWREFLSFLVSRATEGAWPRGIDMTSWKLLPQQRLVHALFLPCYPVLSPHFTGMAAGQPQIPSIAPQSCTGEPLQWLSPSENTEPSESIGIYYFSQTLRQVVKDSLLCWRRWGPSFSKIQHCVSFSPVEHHTRLKDELWKMTFYCFWKSSCKCPMFSSLPQCTSLPASFSPEGSPLSCRSSMLCVQHLIEEYTLVWAREEEESWVWASFFSLLISWP